MAAYAKTTSISRAEWRVSELSDCPNFSCGHLAPSMLVTGCFASSSPHFWYSCYSPELNSIPVLGSPAAQPISFAFCIQHERRPFLSCYLQFSLFSSISSSYIFFPERIPMCGWGFPLLSTFRSTYEALAPVPALPILFSQTPKSKAPSLRSIGLPTYLKVVPVTSSGSLPSTKRIRHGAGR